MPRKNRRVLIIAKPGRAHQHLIDNYASVPDGELRVGHVLLMYIENEHSLSKIIEPVKAKLRVSTPRSYMANRLKSLVGKTLGKYRNLTRKCEMQKFIEICCEVFTVPAIEEVISANTPQKFNEQVVSSSMEDVPATPSNETKAVPGTSPIEATSAPVPVTSPIKYSLRGECVTPREAKLKKRLTFISKSFNDMKEKHRSVLRNLRSKLPGSNRIQILNQVIRRREATIDRLKRHISTSAMARELADTKKQLVQLKRAHRRVKHYHQQKLTSTYSFSGVVNDDVMKPTNEIEAKDSVVSTSENEKLEPEEVVESLQMSDLSLFQKRGKMFLTNIRMFVYDCIVNQVPTQNIPKLVQTFLQRAGVQLTDIPDSSSIEMMIRELGVVLDLQALEVQ